MYFLSAIQIKIIEQNSYISLFYCVELTKNATHNTDQNILKQKLKSLCIIRVARISQLIDFVKITNNMSNIFMLKINPLHFVL